MIRSDAEAATWIPDMPILELRGKGVHGSELQQDL